MTTTRAYGVENLPANVVTLTNIAIISLDTWKADLKTSVLLGLCDVNWKKKKNNRDLLLCQLSRGI